MSEHGLLSDLAEMSEEDFQKLLKSVSGEKTMTALELRTWRLDRKLTRRGLAALLGVSWRTVEKWELGTIPIPLGRVLHIRRIEEGG